MKNFQFFPIKYNVTYGFSIHGLYYSEVCSFFMHFVKGFIMKVYCILWNVCCGDHVIFIFHWCITSIDLHMLNDSWISEINPTLSWYIIPLIIFEFNLLIYFWELLYLYLSGISVWFSCGIHIWFWHHLMLAL